MEIAFQLNIIRETLIKVFSETQNWFTKNDSLLKFKPINEGWTILEILEHIYLTNFFLLKLIEKGYQKSLKNLDNLNLETELVGYNFLNNQLENIGEHQSFIWIRPEHMIPKGEISFEEISINLDLQLRQCLEYLDNLPNGEGVLYKTTMTVNGLGKIDVYQYLYFLAMHIQRHLSQMRKNEENYLL